MRFIFLLGGFVAFSLVACTGWLAGRSGDLVLRDASFAALGGALLFRWFWSIYIRVVSEALRSKRAVRAAVEEAEAAEAAEKAKPVSALGMSAKAR